MVWKGYIPKGCLTLLDGEPGCGKSTLITEIAARVSTNTSMPDGSICNSHGGVLLLQAEDDAVSKVHASLLAANADLGKIITIQDSDSEFTPFDQISVVEKVIKCKNIQLIVIDPLSAFITANTGNNLSVRKALDPIISLAKKMNVAVVIVRHLAKNSKGSSINRGLGSIGIIGVARSALLVGHEPIETDPHTHVLVLNKSNLGSARSLRYMTVKDDLGRLTVKWLKSCDITAEQLGARNAMLGEAIQDAISFLKDILSDGPLAAADVYRSATENGISKTTLERAKKLLVIHSEKQGNGVGSKWIWILKEPIQ